MKLKIQINREINKTKRWFFEKITNFNKSLARLTRKKRKESEYKLFKLLMLQMKEGS